MTQEEKAKAYDEALKQAKFYHGNCPSEPERKKLEKMFPALRESKDERMRKSLIKFLTDIKEISESGRTSWAVRKEDAEMCKSFLAWLEKQKEQKDYRKLYEDIAQSEWFKKAYAGKSLGEEFEQKEQRPILEVFGFKVGDAVRLKDGDGRKHIIKSFEEVEGLHGPNFYHVEFEDNSARDGIYPGEEYPNGYYTQMEKLEEVQGPPQEEKQVSLTHEPPFDENPSDEEIIEALIKHLKEQDGFLTAIDCISTKVILSWLEKQKEQKPFNVCEQCPYYKTCPDYNAQKFAGATINDEPIPTENKSVDIPLAEWSDEDDSMLNTIIADVKFVQQKCGLGTDEWNVRSKTIRWIKSLPERFNLQPKQEWSEEDERMQKEVEKMIVLFT